MEIILLIGSGLLFLVIGIGLLYMNSQFVKNAVKVKGEIVDVTEGANGNSGRRLRMYSSIIEFITLDNKAQRFTSPVSSNIKPKIGKVLQVYYHVDNPENAKIASVFNLYVIPVVLILFGLFLFFIISRI
jgi:hypothetical protein